MNEERETRQQPGRRASSGEIIDRLENSVLVWTILGLALIGFVQVFCRYLFNYSFTWYEELGRYLAVFIAFLGAAIGVKSGSHFSMNLVLGHLRRPWQELLQAGVAGLCALFFLVVAFATARVVLRLHGFGNTSPSLGLPMYLVYLPILLFSLLIAGRYLAQGKSALDELRRPVATAPGDTR